MSTQQNPQVETQKAGSGREASGRFARGNSGGPGNPYARQSAKMRQAYLDRVTEEKLNAMIDSMVELAIGGNVPAAKLVFHYVVGKPADVVNPDTLDQEEFDAYKRANGMYAESVKMVHEPDSKLPVALLRGTREGMHTEIKNMLMKGFQKLAEADAAKKQQAPIGNGCNGEKAPIGNGGNGAPGTGGQAASGTQTASGTQAPIGIVCNGGGAPIANGANGRGPELFERYGPKMSRRALKKARKAAKLAAMMPSKNGKH